MQRHKIVARVILLILSIIHFALAAPVSIRRIREVRTDVVDVAEDVTTALRKRWIPSDEWSTSAPDKNAPQNTESSDSEYSDPLGPLGSDAPKDSLSNAASTDPDSPKDSISSVASNYPGPLLFPVDSPPPAHNNLRLDLNPDPQPGLGLTDSSRFSSHLTGSSKPEHEDPSHLMGFEPSSDVVMYPWGWDDTWVTRKHPPPISNPPPRKPGYLEEIFNRPLGSLGPTDDQPPPIPPSGPGPSRRPYFPSDLAPATLGYPLQDPGLPTWAHSQDLGPSTWAHLQDLGPSTWAHLQDLGPSTWAHLQDPGPSTWTHPQDPGPSTWTHPQDPSPSTWVHPQDPWAHPQDPSPSTWAHPQDPWTHPQDPSPPTWAHLQDPSPSTWTHPQDPNPSTWGVTWKYASSPQHGNLDEDFNRPLSSPGSTDDQPPQAPPTRPDPPLGAGLSTPHPPLSPGPLQHESVKTFSELLKGGRFKRHISDSDSAKEGVTGHP
jgi:hypothetical protein